MIEDQIKWHFVRGLAFLRTNNLQSSFAEIHQLDSINSLEILKRQYARFNTLDKFCPVALNLLKGEYYLSSDPQRAIDFLKEALIKEQQLIYDEPSVWGIPVRHYLGAAYLQLKMYNEAEKSFMADLKSYPDNGWSLYGLSKSLIGQNKRKEALQIENKFKLAWKYADVKIESSVF
jgi:tetratricopeptide (TPR) repeat protein